MVVGREQIITRVIEHLNRAPASSMEEIARAAGVSRATLHRHFASREELIIALGWRSLEAWRAMHEEIGLGEALATGSRLAETLEALLVLSAEAAEEHGFALTEHLMGVDAELVAASEELEERERRLFAACRRAGILRADLPDRWIGHALYGLLVAVREALRRGDVARRDASRLLIDTFLRGTA